MNFAGSDDFSAWSLPSFLIFNLWFVILILFDLISLGLLEDVFADKVKNVWKLFKTRSCTTRSNEKISQDRNQKLSSAIR